MPPVGGYVFTPDRIEELLQLGKINPDTAQQLHKSIAPEDLTYGMMSAESDFNPDAMSPKGATGLMQLMPETGMGVAQQFGIQNPDLKDPALNQVLGSVYAKQMVDQFGPELGIAAYNAGPGTIQRNNGIPAQGYEETKAYVPKVLAAQQQFQSQYGSPNQPGAQSVQFPQSTNGVDEIGTFAQEPEQQQFGLSPTARSELGFQQQMDALEQNTLKQERLRTEIQQEKQKQAKIFEQAQRDQIQRQSAIKQATDRSMAVYQKAYQDYLATPVDPNRFWGNLSTGNKVIAAIGVAMGAVGQAISGGRDNPALNIILGALEDDTRSQYLDKAKQAESVRLAGDLHNDLIRGLGSEEQAKLAADSLKIEAVKNTITNLMDQISDSEQLAKGKILIGQLNQAKGEKDQARLELAAQSPLGQMDAKMSALKDPSPQNMARLKDDEKAKMVNGVGFALSKDDKKIVAEQYAKYKQITKIADDMIARRKGFYDPVTGEATGGRVAGKLLDPKTKAEQNADKQSLILVLKDLYHLGALQEHEQKLIEQIVSADPTSWNMYSGAFGADPVLARLNLLVQRTTESWINNAKPRMEMMLSPEELGTSVTGRSKPAPSFQARR